MDDPIFRSTHQPVSPRASARASDKARARRRRRLRRRLSQRVHWSIYVGVGLLGLGAVALTAAALLSR